MIQPPEACWIRVTTGTSRWAVVKNRIANADGSVDVYFGPEAPKGKEKNWVPTNPDKGFFLVFRFYGPTEGYIDKTWVLDDLERME
jgi:hypothetical protein